MIARFLLAAMVAGAGACGAADGGARAEQACSTGRIVIEAVPADSFSTEERCRLVRRAIESVGAAEPASGLVPSDTAAVRGALIVPLSRATEDGGVLRAMLHVSLALQGRPYDAEVIFDRRSGGVTATRIHKPH